MDIRFVVTASEVLTFVNHEPGLAIPRNLWSALITVGLIDDDRRAVDRGPVGVEAYRVDVIAGLLIGLLGQGLVVRRSTIDPHHQKLIATARNDR
jgi:hypothetical protein